ncbi:MAG: hypothetical protein KAH25_06905 [Bacteroidales bacterium]|nr:hypothetical protein [Bacteroidales bacterium]
MKREKVFFLKKTQAFYNGLNSLITGSHLLINSNINIIKQLAVMTIVVWDEKISLGINVDEKCFIIFQLDMDDYVY